MPHTSPDSIPETIDIFLSSYSLNTTYIRRFVQFLGKVLFKIQMVFMSKGWTKGFGIEDKVVEERIYIYIYIYMCVCVCVGAHTQEKREKRERRKKRKRKEKRNEEGK
jgi:hypothetical protein